MITNKSLIAYHRANPSKKESHMCPDIKNHEIHQKVFQRHPRWDSTETGRILEGLQAVSGLYQVLPDAKQRVIHVQWRREKITHIGQVNIEQVIHPICTMTIASRGSRSMAEILPDG